MSRTERHLESVDDDRSSGIVPYCYLGSQVIVAALFVIAILSVPVSMTKASPVELAVQTALHEDEAWKEDDIHSDFGLDSQSFTIEPAAGPSSPAEFQTCPSLLVEESGCNQ